MLHDVDPVDPMKIFMGTEPNVPKWFVHDKLMREDTCTHSYIAYDAHDNP